VVGTSLVSHGHPDLPLKNKQRIFYFIKQNAKVTLKIYYLTSAKVEK